MLFLRHLLQLIMAPHTGWADISSVDKPVSFWMSKGFYPLLAICSLSCIVSYFYHPDLSIGICIQRMLITFIGFYATYYIAGLVFATALNRLVRLPDASDLTISGAISRFNTMTIFCTGLMMLLTLIGNLMPFELIVTKFLYLYILFIIYRASDFIGIEQDRIGLYTLTSFIAVFIPPFCIMEWLSTLLS